MNPVHNHPVEYVDEPPQGCCRDGLLRILQPQGIIYTCQNGTWAPVGGSGTLPAPTGPNQILYSPDGVTVGWTALDVGTF